MSARETTAVMVPCIEHGESAWCYEQDDGSHVDAELCVCFWTPSADCPVDAHFHDAKGVR